MITNTKSNYKRFFVLMFLTMFMGFAQAKGGLTGLDEMNDLLLEVFDWATIFVMTIATLYFLWTVGMCLIERKQWNDAMMSLIYCLIAGGGALLAKWGVAYFAG